jgi:hypothetical protein
MNTGFSSPGYRYSKSWHQEPLSSVVFGHVGRVIATLSKGESKLFEYGIAVRTRDRQQVSPKVMSIKGIWITRGRFGLTLPPVYSRYSDHWCKSLPQKESSLVCSLDILSGLTSHSRPRYLMHTIYKAEPAQ